MSKKTKPGLNCAEDGTEAEHSVTTIDSLPSELLFEILGHSDWKTVVKARLVNKKWFSVATSPYLWRNRHDFSVREDTPVEDFKVLATFTEVRELNFVVSVASSELVKILPLFPHLEQLVLNDGTAWTDDVIDVVKGSCQKLALLSLANLPVDWDQSTHFMSFIEINELRSLVLTSRPGEHLNLSSTMAFIVMVFSDKMEEVIICDVEERGEDIVVAARIVHFPRDC